MQLNDDERKKELFDRSRTALSWKHSLLCVSPAFSSLSLGVVGAFGSIRPPFLFPTNHCADAVFAEKTPIVTHVSFRLFSYIARNARGTCSPVQKTHNKPQHIPMERRCPHWKGEKIPHRGQHHRCWFGFFFRNFVLSLAGWLIVF